MPAMNAAQRIDCLPKVRRPAEEDWLRLRPTIERLYKDEGKSRRQVCDILLAQHDLSITENMFKKAMPRLQIFKKKKRHDIVIAVKILEQRKKHGKGTSITIRDQKVTLDDINNYLKRRPLTVGEQHQSLDGMSIPSDLRYATPVPEQSPIESVQITGALSQEAPLPSQCREHATVERNNVRLMRSSIMTPIFAARSDVDLCAFINQLEEPQPQAMLYCLKPRDDFLRHFYRFAEVTESLDMSAYAEILTLSGTLTLEQQRWVNVSTKFEDWPSHTSHKERCIVSGERSSTRSNSLIRSPVRAAVAVAKFVESVSSSQYRYELLCHLYDSVSQRLEPFHPLVDFICSAARAYQYNLTAAIESTLPGYVEHHLEHNTAPKGLITRAVLTKTLSLRNPSRILLDHIVSDWGHLCQGCRSFLDKSPFLDQLLNESVKDRLTDTLFRELWATHEVSSSVENQSTIVQRVIAHLESMTDGKQYADLWSSVVFTIMMSNTERIFLSISEGTGARNYANQIIHHLRNDRKTLHDSEWLVCAASSELLDAYVDMKPGVSLPGLIKTKSIYLLPIHAPATCHHGFCNEVRKCLKLWVGQDLCCI